MEAEEVCQVIDVSIAGVLCVIVSQYAVKLSEFVGSCDNARARTNFPILSLNDLR